MTSNPAAASVPRRAACLRGAGEMAAIMRSFDWGATALGAVEGWPHSLCTAVRILLGSRQGMWLIWGPEQVFLYNDAWRNMTMAERHPWALGRPAAEVWSDVWPAVQERIAPLLATGDAGSDYELMLLMQRGDRLEETYHTVSYCPLPDDDGHIAGLLCIGVDDTARVLQERRLHCLRETAAIVASPQPEDAMAATLQQALGRCARDLPFTLAYLFDGGGEARLACTSGIARGHPGAPECIAASDAVPWPAAAVRHGGTLVLDDLAGLGELPRGAWDRPPAAAALVSYTPSWQQQAAGFMVVGLQPYQPWDTSYQEFVQQLADRVCAGLSVARSHANGNVDAKAAAPAVAAGRSGRGHQRRALRGARAEVAQMRRSMERLRELAHTLADFSPPGEDRGDAAKETVTLSAYTTELASLFRDTIESAELRLVVDCPPLAEPVDVDPALWEKLVLQLLSNAREVTSAGAITLGLRRVGRAIELTVADTGSGVPARKVPPLQELARLLGATVRVDSGEGRGSSFTVVLPADRIPAGGAAARGAPSRPPAAAARILVADDDPDMRRYLHRLLGTHYHVQAFAVATAALAAARAMVPDLVLVDALLPDLDGAAFARVLRADPRTRGVPVIQLTAPMRRNAASGDNGAEDRLVKPFTAQELLARVRARLELARMQREAAAREQALSATSEEAEGMKRLHEFSSRLLTINGLQPLLEEVLDATMALHGADFGVVQQVDVASGGLVIVAQRNLPQAFLTHFARVHDDSTVSGRAMRRLERVIVEDVLADPPFARHRAIAETAGVRGVQSTPLVSRKGELLGVISTQFRQPRRFSVTELRFTDLYARHAADIVERSRAEEALRASEERFRRYFDLGLIGMALTSPGKGCLEVNDELCRIFGYPREELMRLRWPELTHPDDLAADEVQFGRVIAGEQDGYVLEKRFIRKDGQLVWCTMAAQCVRAADGSVEFLVALVQDMTERLQSDEALRGAREQLTHVARVAAMGELVASIAHEINQPLAAIVANGHATARWLAAQPPNHGEAEAAVQRIVADAHRVSEFVVGIRRFVRRSEAQRAPVDLHALVYEVARMLEPEARTRGVRLQIEPFRGEAIPVDGNRVQLQQVILNLAMNGFDAMASRAQAQRCLRIAVEFEAEAEAEADDSRTVRVDVCDSGHGVPPLERERIFDAFHTTKPAGMGLGLAISRSIIDAHGGRLWCTPNPGGGETFSFTLPT
ncbi:PAS domain S-box protein [Ramlibacter ginsenosidimutans]|uniref:histidine kinase n=1 Tax=Ramlibacter ginsenosidimutans TaxID=502333 RepID=A0A934WKR8_9BURK|nr:ATP-binding protein [Ramlibacter ginsenosidimutans]MBK6004776.1 PAS domain S-box protein [Ramlibacter ginsenosidimutans]